MKSLIAYSVFENLGYNESGLYLWPGWVDASLRLGGLGSSFTLLALLWVIGKVGRVLGVGI
jgi:hypothetical protein